jgi:hypothetical protein
MNEHLEKASHDIVFLIFDLRQTYSSSCTENPLAGILIYEMMEKAISIKNRISEIQGLIK